MSRIRPVTCWPRCSEKYPANTSAQTTHCTVFSSLTASQRNFKGHHINVQSLASSAPQHHKSVALPSSPKKNPSCFCFLYVFEMTGILYFEQEGSSKIQHISVFHLT